MGSALVGLLGGAAGRYSQIQDEKRKEESANRELLTRLIGQHIENNWDTMGPEERQRSMGALVNFSNVDPKIAEPLLAIGSQVHQLTMQPKQQKQIPTAPQAAPQQMPGSTQVPQTALQPMPQLPTQASIAPQTQTFNTGIEYKAALKQKMEEDSIQQDLAALKANGASPEELRQFELVQRSRGMAGVIGAGIRSQGMERANLLRLQQMGLKGKAQWADFPDGSQHLIFVNDVGGGVHDLTTGRQLSQGMAGEANPQTSLPALPQPPAGLEGVTRPSPPIMPQVVQDEKGNFVQLGKSEMNKRMKRDKAVAGVYPVKGAPKTQGQGTFSPVVDNQGNIKGFYNTKNPSTTASVPPELAGTRKTGVSSQELTQRSNLIDMATSLRDLEKLATDPAVKEYIGPIRGRIAGVARGFINYPAEVNEMFRLADNMGDILLRARSGAQINEREYARLRTLVPNPRENPGKFDTDMKSFKRELKTILEVRGLDENGEPKATGGFPSIPSPKAETKRGRYNPSTGQVEY